MLPFSSPIRILQAEHTPCLCFRKYILWFVFASPTSHPLSPSPAKPGSPLRCGEISEMRCPGSVAEMLTGAVKETWKSVFWDNSLACTVILLLKDQILNVNG